MSTIATRPAADPLDDIDRESSGADSSMERRDRADLPGERPEHAPSEGDVFSEATRAVAEEEILDDDQARIDEDREASRVASGDPDVVPESHGVDDDDPIDETERAGDDANP